MESTAFMGARDNNIRQADMVRDPTQPVLCSGGLGIQNEDSVSFLVVDLVDERTWLAALQLGPTPAPVNRQRRNGDLDLPDGVGLQDAEPNCHDWVSAAVRTNSGEVDRLGVVSC